MQSPRFRPFSVVRRFFSIKGFPRESSSDSKGAWGDSRTQDRTGPDTRAKAEYAALRDAVERLREQLGRQGEQLAERDDQLAERDQLIAALRDEIMLLRDEVRALKGLPKRPRMKPSGMGAARLAAELEGGSPSGAILSLAP